MVGGKNNLTQCWHEEGAKTPDLDDVLYWMLHVMPAHTCNVLIMV
jgi:hypothetical protein